MLKKQLLDRLITIRKELHENPETSFKEFETRKRMKSYLKQFGVKEECMKEFEPTALIVDLSGEAEPEGKDICIGFRADMDALAMVETNQDLPYQSKNIGAAHMCGHDGHMTCLLGFVPLFLQRIATIPKNKTIRLLFQPSEEGPASGAQKMVEQGCLDGVDQVYGFHQWPTAPLGELWCKEGPVMSQITILKISIIGTSGHGSEPQGLKLAYRAAINFYQQFVQFTEQLMKEKPDKFVCTLPVIQTGQRFNVISDSAVIEGSIRSFQLGLNTIILKKVEEMLAELQKDGFKCKLEWNVTPLNSNTKNEAEHVLRVAKKLFGEDKVGPGKLPFRASQDFSYFTQAKPGAYFFFSSSYQEPQPMVHNSNFNFNDKLIDPAATFWMKLAEDRLGINQ